MLTIGEYVEKEKQARGMTLDELYSLTGIRPSHLSRLIRRPPSTPDKETVEKFAAAFQVQPSAIWKAISEDRPPRALSINERVFARISRHLERLPRDKQEKAVLALERAAQDLADFANV